jgi:glucose/arabinose dehydrogenase
MNVTRVWVALFVAAAAAACRSPALPPGSPDNGGLALPDGFEAVVLHEGLGRARHLAVTDDGIVYVKLRSPKPKGLVALRDTNNDGRADEVEVFGDYDDTGDYGTGLRIHDGYIYFATKGEVYRQKIVRGRLVPTGPVQLILRHDYKDTLPSYEHITKPLAFDGRGHMYVPFGAPGDSCQQVNRRPGSPGQDPCPELELQGGIWEFDANREGQTQRDGRRYATGIRSVVAMAWNRRVNELYALQHGRDDLYRSWSQFYTRWQSAVLPSEEFFKVSDGFDGGWPYAYYDHMQGKKLLNPEYGGREEAGENRAREAAHGLSGPLGPQRSFVLRRQSVSGALSAGCVHRVPWIDDPNALFAGGLLRSLRSIRGRRAVGAVGSLRRRICRRGPDRQHERCSRETHRTGAGP